MVGPQNGHQSPSTARFTKFFGNNPINLPAANQASNGIYLDAHAEVARGIALSFGEVRPFVELRAGAETLARAGVDVTIGTLGQDGLRLRDQVSGQRVAAVNGFQNAGGWSFLLGADTAYVASSVYLPDNRGVPTSRSCVTGSARASISALETAISSTGVTYLSEEFEGQPEGQVVGTLSFDLRF